PLAIVLMLMTFLSPLFHHARSVYVSTTIVRFLIIIVDGCKSIIYRLKMDYYVWLKTIMSFYYSIFPLYDEGHGWLLPALIVIAISGTISRIYKRVSVQA